MVEHKLTLEMKTDTFFYIDDKDELYQFHIQNAVEFTNAIGFLYKKYGLMQEKWIKEMEELAGKDIDTVMKYYTVTKAASEFYKQRYFDVQKTLSEKTVEQCNFIPQLISQIETLKRENDEKLKEVEESKKHTDSYRNELNKVKMLAKEMEDQVKKSGFQFVQKTKSLEKELSVLKKQKKKQECEFEKQKSEWNLQKSEMEKTIESLKSIQTQLNAEVEKWKQEIKKLQESKKQQDQKSQVKTVESKIACSLCTSIKQQAEEKNREMSLQIQQLDKKWSSMKKENQQLEKQIQMFEKNQSSWKEKEQIYTTTIESIKKQMNEKQEQFEKEKKQIETGCLFWKNRSAELQSKMDEQFFYMSQAYNELYSKYDTLIRPSYQKEPHLE